MTQFDIIVVLLLGVSGLAGWLRGAVREVMTVLAFVLAVLAALFSLKFIGPVFRHWIHTVWLANIAAGIIVFVLAYIAVRLASVRLVHHVRQAGHLSLLDHVLGLGFGLVRGLILLGLFQLVFQAATPPERMPKWIAGAAFYPLAVDSGKVLRLLAPEGSVMARQFAPTLQHAVTDNPDEQSATPAQTVEKPN